MFGEIFEEYNKLANDLDTFKPRKKEHWKNVPVYLKISFHITPDSGYPTKI